jgi:NAD(P)-dependent dehydrogenase (short-subunit alcohol dehydrogenase family)
MKSIFITGGARGIGLETARLFLAKGWHVGIFDQDQVAIDVAFRTLDSEHLMSFRGDVLDAEGVRQALDHFTQKTEGRLDVLHNNVGILDVGEFEELSVAKHLQIVDVNLKGIINTTYTALPFLKKAHGACIVNMSSASAIYGNPEITTYAATKAAIKNLTEGWSIAFRKHQIKVVDLLPIYVRTRMVDDYHQKYRNLTLNSVKLTPEMVAQAVWKAVHNQKIHHYLGMETKVYARLVNWMPDRWIPGIVRRVLGYRD